MSATENLPIEQVKAIEALLSSGNKTSAARAAGVDRSTLYRWMSSDANFQAALEEATRASIQDFSRALVRLTDKAVKVLEDAMSPKEKMDHRLRAADKVTSRLLAVRELVNLEERLGALEELLAKQNN